MPAIYGDEVQLNKYCKSITKIKGKFPAFHSVTGHVIQGFKNVWNELGSTLIKVNELTAYHQKINFPIVPSDIEHSWLAEMNEEDKSLEDKSISKYIVEQELKPAITQDLNDLSINGVYDANDLETYGKSMNGLSAVLTAGKANVDNPMYKIQLAALTDSNIVDQVTKFERAIPKKMAKYIKIIFMSTANAERYALNYEDKYGANTLIKDGDMFKTRLGKRTIVGLDNLNDDTIFSTPDGNMLKLTDIFDFPQVTDIQKADYKLKIFMEFWLGYGFWVNQWVFVSTTSAGSGLGAQNSTYYS
jgi:hypothetical protein